MTEVSGRRSFFTTLASVAGLAALRPGDASAQAAPPSAGPFDMAWLEQMKGQHKQLYDLGSFDLGADGRPMRFCKNFLDTFRDVYKLEHPGINTAAGISGPAIAMNMSDRVWEKYKLGERSKIIDPIQSRTAVFRFRPIPKEAMEAYLKMIAKEEGVAVKPDGLDAITSSFLPSFLCCHSGTRDITCWRDSGRPADLRRNHLVRNKPGDRDTTFG